LLHPETSSRTTRSRKTEPLLAWFIKALIPA